MEDMIKRNSSKGKGHVWVTLRAYMTPFERRPHVTAPSELLKTLPAASKRQEILPYFSQSCCKMWTGDLEA